MCEKRSTKETFIYPERHVTKMQQLESEYKVLQRSEKKTIHTCIEKDPQKRLLYMERETCKKDP